MRISSTKSSSRKTLLIIGLLLAAALLGWLYAAHHYQTWPFLPSATQVTPVNKVNYDDPSSEQIAAGQQAKNDAETKQTEVSTERAGTTPTPTTPVSVSMIISSANTKDSVLTIRTVIQTIDNSGTCTLELSHAGSASITQSSSTQSMGSYSTCEGFSVDTASLAKGSWTVKVSYAGSASQTSSAQKDITLQ